MGESVVAKGLAIRQRREKSIPHGRGRMPRNESSFFPIIQLTWQTKKNVMQSTKKCIRCGASTKSTTPTEPDLPVRTKKRQPTKHYYSPQSLVIFNTIFSSSQKQSSSFVAFPKSVSQSGSNSSDMSWAPEITYPCRTIRRTEQRFL